MKKIAIYSLTLVAAALSGCRNDGVKNPVEETIEPDTPILLTSIVTPSRTPNTDLQKTQLEEGVQIGLFVVHEDNSFKYDNEPLTADGRGYFIGSTLYFPNEGSVSLYAYAPYNPDWVYGENDFSVNSDQTEDKGYLDSDLLYAQPIGDNRFDKNTTKAISLAHAHKLAKVTVKFNVLDESDLTGATISILNTLPTVSINTKDGSLGVAKGSPTAIKAHVSQKAGGEDASVVIVPQSLTGGTPFIRVEKSDGLKSVEASLNTGVTFAEGKSYTYTINLSAESASIELASSLDDWSMGGNLQGEADEE